MDGRYLKYQWQLKHNIYNLRLNIWRNFKDLAQLPFATNETKVEHHQKLYS